MFQKQIPTQRRPRAARLFAASGLVSRLAVEAETCNVSVVSGEIKSPYLTSAGVCVLYQTIPGHNLLNVINCGLSFQRAAAHQHLCFLLDGFQLLP